MASETTRITVRLPSRTVTRLEELVRRDDYPTLSEAVRDSIDRLLEAKFPPNHIERVTLDLPKGRVVDLQQLVRSGDSVSLEDAIRNAIREYVRGQIAGSSK
jgi:Arc/MetJ-type ribon-helix-helix transcriptional regulator